MRIESDIIIASICALPLLLSYCFIRKYPRCDLLQTFDVFLLVAIIYIYIPSLIIFFDNNWSEYYRFDFNPNLVYLVVNLGFYSIFAGYFFFISFIENKANFYKNPYKISKLNLFCNITKFEKHIFFMLILLVGIGMVSVLISRSEELLGLASGVNDIDVYRIKIRHAGLAGPITIIINYLLFIVTPAFFALNKALPSRLLSFAKYLFVLLSIFYFISL